MKTRLTFGVQVRRQHDDQRGWYHFADDGRRYGFTGYGLTADAAIRDLCDAVLQEFGGLS